MTNSEAQAIVEKIEALRSSETRQANIEFEGFNPGFLPQAEQRRELIRQINNSGTHAYHLGGELIERESFMATRETWNNLVRNWMAANPGKQVPSSQVQDWQKQIGMTIADIKGYVATFETADNGGKDDEDYDDDDE